MIRDEKVPLLLSYEQRDGVALLDYALSIREHKNQRRATKLHIISKRPLREFWEKHPDAQPPLEDWWKITKHADWNNLAETRADFSHADPVGACTVFNVGGNKYRLITKINYRSKIVYVRFVLTHPEYSRGSWKNDCY